MSSVNQGATLIALATFLDLYNKRSHLTLLFSGTQGIGKSESLYLAAEKVNGFAATIDGSVLNDGELPGIPFRKKSGKASIDVDSYIDQVNIAIRKLKQELESKDISEDQFNTMSKLITEELLKANMVQDEKLDYAKYPTFAEMERLQEYYYNIALHEGFRLPIGVFKLDENLNEVIIPDNEPEKVIYVKKYNKAEAAADGGKNKFELGTNLALEDKIYLMTSGQIKPFLVLIDELNRPDQRTMSEMMNATLNRQMTGYRFPFWVSVCGAQNPAGADSDFATATLDPAQLDRFAFIQMNSNLEDWAMRSLNGGLPESYVSAIAINGQDVFSPEEKKHVDAPVITPSPRSNTIAATVLKHFDEVLALPCFTDADRKDRDMYLQMILSGLLGQSAMNCILSTMKDTETMVTIPEILTGKSNIIDKTVQDKINRKTTLGQKILLQSLISWIQKNWLTIASYEKSTKVEEKSKYSNILSQLGALFNSTNTAVLNWFYDKIASTQFECIKPDGEKVNCDLVWELFDILHSTECAKTLENFTSYKKYID